MAGSLCFSYSFQILCQFIYATSFAKGFSVECMLWYYHPLFLGIIAYMGMPSISFHFNKALDKEISLVFLNDKNVKAGYDFVALITNMHPELKHFYEIPLECRKEYLDDYIELYYTKHKKELLAAKKDFEKIWGSVEPQFFKVTAKYFNDLVWPKGKYRCNISIFPIGPRFLETCEFQTCYTWYKNLKGQIIHEMLHFQFYNLITLLGLNKTNDSEIIWELSEVFNNIIQQELDYVKIQGYKTGISYPDLEEKYNKYKKIWQKDKDASNFISKILN